MNYFSSKASKGFTLIEIIVSLAVFSIVATVALGALVRVVSANKKAQTLQSAITNLNFALESMSRELRVGSSYYCVPSGNFTYTGGSALAPNACDIDNNEAIFFRSAKVSGSGVNACRLVYAYRFTNAGTPQNPEWIMEKAQQDDCNDPITPSAGEFTPVISTNVIVTDYDLGIEYDAGTDPFPRAFIRLGGYAGTREREKTYFDVQTAVSSRLP